YISPGFDNGTWLYNGDRAGSRYYNVMHTTANGGSNFSGRFNPQFRKYNAFQGAIFTKFKGLELFGFYESVMGDKAESLITGGAFNQLGADLIFRFGESEKFYIATRYNMVQGFGNGANNTIGLQKAGNQEIHRINAGGGWFITKNIITKVEYVQNRYFGEGWEGTQYQGAEFGGVVIEAAISF
ncbi:MAG: hypothetical protein WEC59_00810, partial [Salibacteraceae bacterium]